MNIVGIIAEFNPLHNGHKYLIDQAKQLCQADYVIVVMSGNFTQRGTPAIYDKYTRTNMALLSGADLVIEMPVVAACSGAKDFARSGVSLLHSTGIVTHLAFGCESPNITDLSVLANILLEEPLEYQNQLKIHLKEGLSWPAARQKAIDLLYPHLKDYLKEPNNILALEYLMALKEFNSPITPVPIQRIQTGYHDLSTKHTICSATALRNQIENNADLDSVLFHIPECIYDYGYEVISKKYPMVANDLSAPLVYTLIRQNAQELSQYLDIDTDLAQRIINEKETILGFDAFCMQLKNRAYTQTRISRALLHILLDIKTSDRQHLANCNYAPYIKVLGFNKRSSDILTGIKNHCSLPLLTRNSSANSLIHTSEAARLYELDIFASEVYRSIYNLHGKESMSHEFRTPIIIN